MSDVRDIEKFSPGETLLRFYDPEESVKGFRDTGWDPQERQRILVEIARANETITKMNQEGDTIEVVRASPRDQMAAIKLLDEGIEKALRISGSLRDITAVATKGLPGGGTSTITEQGTRVEYPDRDRMLSTIELLELADTQDVDLETTEKTNGTSNGECIRGGEQERGDRGGSPGVPGRGSGGVWPGPSQPGDWPVPAVCSGPAGSPADPCGTPGGTQERLDNPGGVAAEPGPNPEGAGIGDPAGRPECQDGPAGGTTGADDSNDGPQAASGSGGSRDEQPE